MSRLFFVATGCFFLLSSCAATSVEPRAVTVLGTGACQTDYVAVGAIALAFGEGRAEKEVSVDVTVGGESNCITLPDDNKSSYAVFKLPSVVDDYAIVAGSLYEANRVMPPVIVTLGRDGKPIREMGHDRLLERQGHWSASFHPQPDEAYVVIRSNPELVGEGQSRVKTGVGAMYVPVGLGGVMVSTSADSASQVTYSHYGKVRVRIYRDRDA